ncbi:immune inhibitor A domain-containing protein [Pseudobdellovibrio exovorus]|uniref:Peptidase M6-like domain-containing protein n=1 Tax=Pseudobdellovibrio exovorus JSS TaxID=1184267 RepID=M4VCM4_9BACT|nr:immune inhibitor A domain-containing protein [Pseudobdellovibrio exovorus]AGH96235.1 hypothetical protein A11Q_2019 [Pseudobdellovibrio exovorus JSS]
MKRLLVVLLAMMGTLSVQAQMLYESDELPELGLSSDAPVETQLIPPLSAEAHRWLYEILFTEADRRQQPKESFKSFYVHLEDTYKRFPHPEQLKASNLRLVNRVEGKIKYVSIVQKKYVYDVLKAQDGTLVLNVRVHLKNPQGTDVQDFRNKMTEAARIWNQRRVAADFNYVFKFDIVERVQDSHFSVNVMNETRGPYDTNWARNWTNVVIAHEVGHMLGLGDEYQTLSGKVDCMRTSLMCSSWTGSLQPHHYYFVLRRLMNSVVY